MSTDFKQRWPKPVLGLAGFSGSGKTTLLCKLIPELTRRGLRLAVVKHSHHNIPADTPGKDSYRFRESGAEQVLLASPNRVALFLPQQDSDNLSAQLRVLDWETLDCVLVEGYRHWTFPKLEIHRPATGKPLLCDTDEHIIAVACDDPVEHCPRPLWPLNDIPTIADHVYQFLFPEKPPL
jgi:molybdopterin-guanine dinucleotide biosynthesis protein MobB